MLVNPGAAGLRLLRVRCPALPSCCPALPGCRPMLALTAWDSGEGSREGGESSPDGMSMDASMPMGMEEPILASWECVCTGASPGREPMGPNRLVEKPCTGDVRSSTSLQPRHASHIGQSCSSCTRPCLMHCFRAGISRSRLLRRSCERRHKPVRGHWVRAAPEQAAGAWAGRAAAGPGWASAAGCQPASSAPAAALTALGLCTLPGQAAAAASVHCLKPGLC